MLYVVVFLKMEPFQFQFIPRFVQVCPLLIFRKLSPLPPGPPRPVPGPCDRRRAAEAAPSRDWQDPRLQHLRQADRLPPGAERARPPRRHPADREAGPAARPGEPAEGGRLLRRLRSAARREDHGLAIPQGPRRAGNKRDSKDVPVAARDRVLDDSVQGSVRSHARLLEDFRRRYRAGVHDQGTRFKKSRSGTTIFPKVSWCFEREETGTSHRMLLENRNQNHSYYKNIKTNELITEMKVIVSFEHHYISSSSTIRL